MVNVSEKNKTKSVPGQSAPEKVDLNGHTIMFHPYKQKVAIRSERFIIDCGIETTCDLLVATIR